MANAFPCSGSASNQNAMNARLYERNIPSATLQPYLSVRSVNTKYSIMPVVDPRYTSNVPLTVQPTYNIGNTFNPGNSVAPWSGFAANIGIESELRNQIHVLQRCSATTYVPSSQSDLYKSHMPPNNQTTDANQRNDLFSSPTFKKFNPIEKHPTAGTLQFNNATRQQMLE